MAPGVMLWWLFACESAEVRDARCSAPLSELVKWRVESRGRAEPLDPKDPWHVPPALEPAALAAVEREHVAAAVAKLRAQQGCEDLWRMTLWSTPDNPAGRLRDEAVRQVLGFPGVPYDAVALGNAGVTTDGRKAGEK